MADRLIDLIAVAIRDRLVEHGYAMSLDTAGDLAEAVVAALPDQDELQRWRNMAEESLGVDDPNEVAEWIRLSGHSIYLGSRYGEWGAETLQYLFGQLLGGCATDAAILVRRAVGVLGEEPER